MSLSLGVIIPVFNAEQYLNKCLDSVVGQEIQFNEVIIVDDGSSDGSPLICEEYAKKYEYIKYIRQDNSGAAVARNVGIETIHTQFVCFLVSDDSVKSDYVKEIKNHLDEDMSIVFFDGDTLDEIEKYKKNVYERRMYAPTGIVTGKRMFSDFFKCYTESPCMGVYNRTFLIEKNIFLPKMKIFEDNFFTLKAVIEAHSIAYINNKLYVRRYRDNSVTTSQFTYQKWLALCQAKELCFDYLSTSFEEQQDGYIKSVIRYLINSIKTLNWRKKFLTNEDITLAKKDFAKIQMRASCVLAKAIDAASNDVMPVDLSMMIVSLLFAMDEVEESLVTSLRRKSDYINKAWDVYKNYIYEKLNKLPLNLSKKIGIYGVGDHTRRMIKWYESFFTIRCELVFIDSYITTGQKEYLGVPIINARDIAEYGLDAIIISSYLYEEEIFNTLKDIYFGDIYRFYEDIRDDIFISMADKPLSLYRKKMFGEKGEI